MVHRILVASYSNDIYTLTFHPEARSLTLTSTVTVGYHPSWITPHPSQKDIVYTALEQQPEGEVVALRVEEEGRLRDIHRVKSGGADPCTVVAVNDHILLGNYSSGTFTVGPQFSQLPSSKDKSPPWTWILQEIKFEGNGPDPDRQQSSHPHQVFHYAQLPVNELLIPDLGTDKTHRLTRDSEDKWHVVGAISYAPGSGPRHVAVHGQILYTVLELSSELSAHRLPVLPAEPVLLDTVSTRMNLPPEVETKDMLAAEILIPPPNTSYPTPYIYVSNRNDPSPEGDTIAIFSTVNEEGKIGYVNQVRSGVKHLRGMAFGGPDDKWLIVGGVHCGKVTVFERVDGGRNLKEVASVRVDAPTGFLWL